jgi:hypothetical protein
VSLEGVCLEQQEIIAKQSAVISALLLELSQYRALDAEERQLIANEGEKEKWTQ